MNYRNAERETTKRMNNMFITDVEIVADIYIVPDYSQNDPIIIGRNVLDDHNIKVTIQGKMLTIENVNVKQVCQIEHNKNYEERNVVNEMVKNEENNFELKDENSDEVIIEVEPEKIDQNYSVNPNLRGKEKKELHEVLNE
ncbi:hypothetical protein QE152_g29351 [Popillia japonica]|uniref:Uncharacterized protein n=1 Tax=Popillia japonica TaxID=7064 RepID=A0AAW1JI23_POPJA